MKFKFSFLIWFTIMFATSACGAQATPTVDVASIQNTAVAAAYTVIAETQAAIPTSTPIPPTETPTQTPLPTETPVPTETSTVAPGLASTATTVVGGTNDPCNAVLPANPLGQPTKIKLENNTGAPITVSIYMNLTPFGQCGFRGYNLGKIDSVTITDLPQACYNVSVFVNDPKKPSKAFGYGCINNPDQWTFVIEKETISLQGR
jgi:hypothetical protein